RHFLCLCCFSKTEFWGAKLPISNWDYLQKSKIFSGDPREGELVSFPMHALHAAFFMPLLLFQNGVLGRKKA
ncbi:MAG: hypothetical protein ACOVKJ_00100, partial [Flavobacterium sp.]